LRFLSYVVTEEEEEGEEEEEENEHVRALFSVSAKSTCVTKALTDF
jgi:hypothetical protein